MRKLLILVIIVLLIGGGYAGIWFKKTGDFKQAIEQDVAAINAHFEDPAHKDVPFIHYDALRVSGFPFAMVFTFEKPVFSYSGARLGALQKPAVTPAFDWSATGTLMGTMAITTNPMMDHFTLTWDGEKKVSMVVAGAPRYDISGTSAPSACHLDIAHQGNILNIPAFQNAQAFLSALRHVDCAIEGIHTKEATKNLPLLDAEAVNLTGDSTPTADGNQKIVFAFEEKNAQTTPAFDVVMGDYMNIVASAFPAGIKNTMSPSFHSAAYGMRNLALRMEYEGPTDKVKFTPDVALHTDLDTKDTNALYHSAAQLHVKLAGRTVDFSLHSDGEYTEGFDALINTMFTDIFKNAAASKPPAFPGQPAPTPDPTSLMFADDAFIKALAPSLHKLGETGLAIDFKLQLPEDKTQQSVVINALDFNATPYSITIKGNATRGTMMPTGDITIVCRACDALVKDLGQYLGGIEKVAAKYKPTPSPLVITDGLIAGMQQFLHGIAEQSDTPDVTIHAIVNQTGATISGKQPNQVMLLFSTLVAPYLQPQGGQPQTAPAAPVAPPAAK